MSIHCCADFETIETFSHNYFFNQLGGEEGMVIAAEDFYHALCSESASTHCLYGLVNALLSLLLDFTCLPGKKALEKEHRWPRLLWYCSRRALLAQTGVGGASHRLDRPSRDDGARDIFIASSDAAGVSWTRASTRLVLHGRAARRYGQVGKAVVEGLRVGAAAAERLLPSPPSAGHGAGADGC